jgi:hypothetical protein
LTRTPDYAGLGTQLIFIKGSATRQDYRLTLIDLGARESRRCKVHRTPSIPLGLFCRVSARCNNANDDSELFVIKA